MKLLATGMAASRGTAVGRAVVITDADSIPAGPLFQRVIVAHNTTPEMILALTHAAAIVTDIGGLLSHAAVVAREFGIPAIVGTGNVTVLVRDGDPVLVDGDAGHLWLLDHLDDIKNSNASEE
jgi:pyruvate,water dikinase